MLCIPFGSLNESLLLQNTALKMMVLAASHLGLAFKSLSHALFGMLSPYMYDSMHELKVYE